jgi:hypothetical protein
VLPIIPSTTERTANRLCNERRSAVWERKSKLTDKIFQRTATDTIDNPAHTPLTGDRSSAASPDPVAAPAAPPGPNGANRSALVKLDADTSPSSTRSESRRLRRAARVESGKRPRAPRAERRADLEITDHADRDADLAADATLDAQAEIALPDDQPIIAFADSGKRGARTVRRASKKQKAAAAAVNASTDNPALGALNRHLNTMTQQLTTAHRIIGRVAAERDALRQQLADLQGIPVEEIVVSTVGASTEAAAQPSKPAQPAAPAQPSKYARLNYFGGEDFAVMRKRRQMLLLAVIGLVFVLGLTSRMGIWVLPSNLSRDSLSNLPFVGDFMAIFLAGWLFFRVIRVSSKGVKWVFPSEDQRRRRR